MPKTPSSTASEGSLGTQASRSGRPPCAAACAAMAMRRPSSPPGTSSQRTYTPSLTANSVSTSAGVPAGAPAGAGPHMREHTVPVSAEESDAVSAESTGTSTVELAAASAAASAAVGVGEPDTSAVGASASASVAHGTSEMSVPPRPAAVVSRSASEPLAHKPVRADAPRAPSEKTEVWIDSPPVLLASHSAASAEEPSAATGLRNKGGKRWGRARAGVAVDSGSRRRAGTSASPAASAAARATHRASSSTCTAPVCKAVSAAPKPTVDTLTVS